ncbi:putative aspartate/glutamate/uridylate kinase [Candidatus Nitrososphaera gargensis Ga9.2]|uniref:Isopentenyl phosphate kinase n=1 Tax=Nitrososphaera gargensis (strain Ga9.2) TaxID=1237085 RepID=K0ICI6_NITGG|nr:isopentenyl phosphate kinase [Candidatus Nitrososphaera gargensis]AFU59091.1 putative aspartate/glutamate/uridylate kinase [Candidatus Nitrososphaera gargensis Ga9.2]
MQKLALIKLGGSVVTFKDKPLAANTGAIDGISRVLAQLSTPAIIVHGGGSFGHYWSVKYDMHTKPAGYDPHGVSVVHESMIALNQIIINSMIRAGLNPYGMPPSVFAAGHKPVAAKIKQIYTMAKSEVMPVTFGDVVHMEGNKYSILSGDALMTMLAKVLRPSRVVFATNVDGIYKDMASRELMREIRVTTGRKKRSIEFSKASGADVTGGMQRKVAEAFKIASRGMDVLMVNGLMPERIAEAVVEGTRLQVGTVVKGSRR